MKKLLLPLIAGSLTVSALPALAMDQDTSKWSWSLPDFTDIRETVLGVPNSELTRSERQARAREERAARAARARNNPYLYKNGPKRTPNFQRY